MHIRRAFKRRGNMSLNDSRAGNATSACATVLNRVRGDMRIVCLITISALLLSAAIADGDVPIGGSQYQHGLRAIVLEPMLKMKPNAEGNPINWFFKLLSKAVEHPKKPPPAIIGPISLPGSSGQIFIRQKENVLSPWQANHVTIKLITRDQSSGSLVPIDYTSSLNNHWDDPYRRNVNQYNYQPINNALQPGFVPVSPQPQHSSWHANQYYHNNNHQYQKPFRPSPPNDYHYNYAREADQNYANKGHYESHRRPSRMNNHHFTPGIAQPMNANSPTASMYRSNAQHQQQSYNRDPGYSRNEYKDRFKDNQVGESADDFYPGTEKSEPLRATQLPYPEYPPISSKVENTSKNFEHASTSSFNISPGYSKQIVRTDRMVQNSGRRNNIHNFRGKSSGSNNRATNYREFREGTKYGNSFGVRDVGGIEVINAPNLHDGWEGYVNDNDDSPESRESQAAFNQEEDSISMENGDKLARGESKDHSNEQNDTQTEKSFVSRSGNAKISSYKVIDRSHRNKSSRKKNKVEKKNSKEILSPQRNNEDTSVETESKAQISSEEPTDTKSGENVRVNTDVSAEVVQKIINETTSKRHNSHVKRTPRIVKAIYRRKPVADIIKSSEESTESSGSREEKSSEEILSSVN